MLLSRQKTYAQFDPSEKTVYFEWFLIFIIYQTETRFTVAIHWSKLLSELFSESASSHIPVCGRRTCGWYYDLNNPNVHLCRVLFQATQFCFHPFRHLQLKLLWSLQCLSYGKLHNYNSKHMWPTEVPQEFVLAKSADLNPSKCCCNNCCYCLILL